MGFSPCKRKREWQKDLRKAGGSAVMDNGRAPVLCPAGSLVHPVHFLFQRERREHGAMEGAQESVRQGLKNVTANCVTSGKFPNLSEPGFSLLSSGAEHRIFRWSDGI
jgi:hypothetical protein